ncbi:hypothetical protein AMATHDRAFT_147815 [Amanita thiersii Skay4041]|uniref:Glycoside hydrolase family 105 protein n=1 Tax=Amanita thiersii Skay4041 TaxID=703135 RepID=A0A2A9NNX7_9AGAR|nr:hypothetical protein AMATHDRAFT_147815 [Amanita thiersii Skay4041]
MHHPASFGLVVLLLSSGAAAVPSASPLPFNPGFDIEKVLSLAQSLPSHSWEFGTAAEALLELYDPSISVFGSSPFPPRKVSADTTKSLQYASPKFQIGTAPSILVDGGGAVGDPASLGVSAVLLGQTDQMLAKAAADQLDYVINGAPRAWNGAISHRSELVELWADFIYMAPPFIAFYGAVHNKIGLLKEAVNQCSQYRQILRANTTKELSGAWIHIMGDAHPDPGIWSTGNAWAAAGMLRVLATVQKAPISRSDASWQKRAVLDLSNWIDEILTAAMNTPTQDGLLPNYWDDTNNEGGHGFGEISGSSLLASVAYRMATIRPAGLSSNAAMNYIRWADGIRRALGGSDTAGNPHVTANGTATPAVNPLGWFDTQPWTAGSPEGQNFVVLMYTAWRDCVQKGICRR